MEQKGRERRGALQALGAALLFSISGVCIKEIPWSPLAINGARGAIGALVLALWMAAAHRRLHCNLAVGIGALSLCLTNILYIFAAKLTTAANAILLQYTSPLFVVLLLPGAARYRPGPRHSFPTPRSSARSRRTLMACQRVFGGTALFFCDRLTPGARLGSLLGLASGLTYAGVFLSGLPQGADGVSSFLLAQLAGAALGLPFLAVEKEFSPSALLAVALLGVFQIGLGFLLLARALVAVGPVTANLLCAIEPILNPLLVALVFGERPGRFALLGAALVLAGVIWYQLGQKTGLRSGQKTPSAAAGSADTGH